MENESKSIFESKTIWINVVAAAITAGLNLAGIPVPEGVMIATIASAVVNIILRFITKQPVHIY